MLAASRPQPAPIAQAIKLADVAELSGGGATVGTNWKNGIDLAIEEINAKGGVLGRKLEVSHADSQSNPGVARAQVQKALDAEPYVLLGPGYSGSVKVTAPLAAEAGIAQIMGGEAAELTQAGNKFLFRTSFGQQSSMPKVANYIHDDMKAKTVAVVWVNNDFGKGGRDDVIKEMTGSASRSSPISRPKPARPISPPTSARSRPPMPDAVFVYLNEEESARILQGAEAPGRHRAADRRDHAARPEGDRACRRCRQRRARPCRPHHGCAGRPDQGVPRQVLKKYKYVPDHNGIKGYIAVYMVKATTEKMGKVDCKAFAETLHGMTINAEDEPGILMDVTCDENGDIDRQSFLVEVVEGKQMIKQVLPKLK